MKLLLVVLFLPLMAFAKGFGIVTIIKGNPVVQNDKGAQKPLAKGDKVFESDTIITSANSLVRLVMMDTNIIDVYPNSKMLIKEYVYNPKENQKNVSLEIAEGKIKSTVKQKYDNDKNKYNVKTPVIVAGVRGTIFLAEHEIKTGRSQVFTEEGHVMVGKLEANQQVKEFFSVLANQRISVDQQPGDKPKVIDVPKVDQDRQKKEDKDDGFAKRIPKQEEAIQQVAAQAGAVRSAVQQTTASGAERATLQRGTEVSTIDASAADEYTTVSKQPADTTTSTATKDGGGAVTVTRGEGIYATPPSGGSTSVGVNSGGSPTPIAVDTGRTTVTPVGVDRVPTSTLSGGGVVNTVTQQPTQTVNPAPTPIATQPAPDTSKDLAKQQQQAAAAQLLLQQQQAAAAAAALLLQQQQQQHQGITGGGFSGGTNGRTVSP